MRAPVPTPLELALQRITQAGRPIRTGATGLTKTQLATLKRHGWLISVPRPLGRRTDRAWTYGPRAEAMHRTQAAERSI